MLQISTGYPIGSEEAPESTHETTEADARQADQHLQLRRRSLGTVPGVRSGEEGHHCWTSRRHSEGKARARRVLAALGFSASLFAADPSTKPRTLTYQDGGEIQTVYTSAGFTTEVKLPKSEEIVFATGAQVCDPTKTAEACGYFGAIFNGRTVVVKYLGSEPGKRTDLRLLCRSGNEYTFLVQEVSRKATAADLIVLVSNESPDAQAAMVAPPKLYTSDQVDALKRDAESLRDSLAKEQERSKTETSKAAMKEFASLNCGYEFFDRKGEDFKPSACTDGKFTRVQVNSSEVPSFFEIKEGKPSLVQAAFQDGHYIIPKVVDSAEMSIGKSRVKFRRIG